MVIGGFMVWVDFVVFFGVWMTYFLFDIFLFVIQQYLQVMRFWMVLCMWFQSLVGLSTCPGCHRHHQEDIIFF